VIRDAGAYQHERGLVTPATRRLPGTLLHILARWRERLPVAYTQSQSQPHGVGSSGDYTADRGSAPSDRQELWSGNQPADHHEVQARGSCAHRRRCPRRARSRSNVVQRATLTYVEQAERHADGDTEAAA
jgi:hypothetical protein